MRIVRNYLQYSIVFGHNYNTTMSMSSICDQIALRQEVDYVATKFLFGEGMKPCKMLWECNAITSTIVGYF